MLQEKSHVSDDYKFCTKIRAQNVRKPFLWLSLFAIDYNELIDKPVINKLINIDKQ